MAKSYFDAPSFSIPSMDIRSMDIPSMDIPSFDLAKSYTKKQVEQRQHLKDLGDIILGNPITGTLQLQHTLQDNGLGEYRYTPILNRVLGLGVMLKERTLDPIKEGNVGEAAVNTFETIGGTLDILANPVKSLFPWAGGGGSNDLAKSMGWAEGEYRKQYQWDTGNFLSDIVLETVSDPLNWLTWGGKEMGKQASDVLADQIKQTITKKSGQLAQTINDAGTEVLIKAIEEATTNEADDLIPELIQRLKDNRAYLQDEVARLTKQNTNKLDIIKLKLDIQEYDKLLDIDAEKYLADIINDIRVSDGYTKYRILRQGAEIATTVNDIVEVSAMALAPMWGIGKAVVQNLIVPAFKAQWNNFVLRRKEINYKDALNNTPGQFRQTVQTIRKNNYKVRQNTYDTFSTLLERYNLDIEKLQDIYASVYKSASYTDRISKETITKLFKNKLAELMPELKQVLYKGNVISDLSQIKKLNPEQYIKLIDTPSYGKELQKILNKISDQDFNNLYDALWESIVITDAAETSMYNTYKKEIDREVKEWFRNTQPEVELPEGSALQHMSYIDRLNFIVSNYFEIDGRTYKLSELPDFINTLNQKDPDLYMKVSALLDYSGITLDNYKQIENLIKVVKYYSSDAHYDVTKVDKAYKKLQNVLKAARTGDLLEIENLENQYHKLSNSFEYAKNVDLKYLNTKEFKKLASEFTDTSIPYETITDAISKYKYLANIPDLQQELKTITKSLEGDAILDLDEAIGIYYNVEIPRSEYIFNVTNFQFDLDEDGAFNKENITQYIRNLRELQQQVKRWMSDIRTEKVQFSIKQTSMITSLNEVLNKQVVVNTINNITDLLDETDSVIYSLLLSKQGMYWIEHTNLVSSMETWSKEHKEWFSQIIDKDSPVRSRLNEIINYLKKNNLPNEAKSMERIIASLEGYILTTNLLSTNITDYKVSKQLNDYLNGLLFNVYKQYEGTDLARMYGKLDVMVDKYMRQLNLDWSEMRITEDLRKNNEPKILQSLSESLTDIEQNRYEELKMLVDDTSDTALKEELEYLEHKLTNRVEQYPDVDLFLNNVKTNITTVMTDYLLQLTRLAKNVHPDLPINWGTNLFTQSITNDMANLGFSYQEVLRALANEHVQPEILKDASNFIMYVAADRIQLDFSEISDLVPYILTQLDGGVEYEKYLKSFISNYLSGEEGTLNNTILTSFRDIRDINDMLRNKQGKDIKAYTGDGLKSIRNINAYITKEHFNSYVRQNLNVANAYEWSTTNGMLAVKKLDKYKAVTLPRLSLDYINIPSDISDITKSSEYLTFINIFEDIYDNIDEYKVFKKETINSYKKALITLYSLDNIYWGPKDPKTYFKTATDRDVYAWYVFSKLKNFNRTTSVKFEEILYRLGHLNPTAAAKYRAQDQLQKIPVQYSYAQRINYNEDPASLFTDLEDIVNKGITNENVYEDIIRDMPLNKIRTVREFATKDITQYYKSPASMKDNMTNVINYHKQDVEALEKTKVLDALMQDNRKAFKVVTNKEQREILKSYGIGPTTTMTDRKVLRFMMEERCNALAENIRSWNPVELRSYIDYNTDGILFYQGEPNFHKKFRPSELVNAGIKIDIVDDIDNIYIIRRTDNVVRPKVHTYTVPTYIFPEQQQAITKMFKANRDYFYWNGMDVPDELFTGQMMDLDNYNVLKESKEIRAILGDKVEQKKYSNLDKNGINNFYKKKTLRPNVAMIGHYDTINNIYNLGNEAFLARGMQVPLATTNLYNSAFSGTLNAIKRVNTEHKYIHLFMNDDYSIKNMQAMFKNASDKELKEFFERGNYTAAIIRQNNKGEPRVYKIHILNRADLDNAINAGAVCLPHEVYRSAVLGINEHAISSQVYRFYKQAIVTTFKSLYLTTPGFLMRNFLDTAIYKNASTDGGVLGIYENMQYYSKAAQLWKNYNDIQAAMLADSANQTLNKRMVRHYLRQLNPTEREQYMLIDMFATSSASGSLSEALEDMLRMHNMSDDIPLEEMWLNFYNEKVLYGKYSPVRLVNDINSQIEQYSRLGLFLKLVDEGAEFTSAIKTVTNTHFDYKLKEPGAKTMEEIFWFSTFPINNMYYFFNEGITKNPDMFRLYMDMMEQSYNNDGYTWDDVRNSNYLTYHLLAGNLRIYNNGNSIMLKTGSSVMDFFSSLFSPFEAAGERLNPFLAVLLGMDELEELNPLSSFAYRLKQIKEGNSYLPSVYTKMYPRQTYNYPKRSYNYRTFSWSPNIKKVSSYHRNMAYMNYKFMTNRYYFNRGKNIDRWLSSTNSIEPNWYMYNYRHYRANGRYGRAVRKLKLPKAYKTSVSK